MLIRPPVLGAAARREAGFTTIELLIAMVLAVVVLSTVLMTTTTMFQGASTQSASRRNSAEAADAAEQFERDVRAAESPDRINSTLIRDDMRATILWGSTRSATGQLVTVTGTACDTALELSTTYCTNEDVTIATPSELWFRADVDATHPGHECVAWRVVSGELRRRVTADGARCRPGDLGTQVEDARILRAPPNAVLGNVAGTSASFLYLARYNPVAAGAPINTVVDMDDCNSFAFPAGTTLNDRRRGFIVTVTLDLAAWTTGGDSDSAPTASRSRLTSSATIQSRGTDDYTYWTGCGQ